MYIKSKYRQKVISAVRSLDTNDPQGQQKNFFVSSPDAVTQVCSVCERSQCCTCIICVLPLYVYYTGICFREEGREGGRKEGREGGREHSGKREQKAERQV